MAPPEISGSHLSDHSGSIDHRCSNSSRKMSRGLGRILGWITGRPDDPAVLHLPTLHQARQIRELFQTRNYETSKSFRRSPKSLKVKSKCNARVRPMKRSSFATWLAPGTDPASLTGQVLNAGVAIDQICRAKKRFATRSATKA